MSARTRCLTLLTLLAGVTLLAGACSSAAAPAPLDQRTGGQTNVGPAFAGATAAPQPADASTGQGGAAGSGQLDVLTLGQPLIVKTGTLQLQVKDVDAALVQARTVVVGLGGYVSGSQQAVKGDFPVASITYRIPADRWDEAITGLRALATKVLAEQTQAQEVTGQVLDLGARLDNLRVTEKALQAIMAQATKIPDVLAVQTQLTDVQGQIEQLTTQRDHLQQQAAYGTLTAGFEAPVVATTQAQKGWDLGAQVDQAVAQLVQLGQGLATVAVYLGIVILPFALVALLVLGLLSLLIRRLGGRSRRGEVAPTGGPAAT